MQAGALTSSKADMGGRRQCSCSARALMARGHRSAAQSSPQPVASPAEKTMASTSPPSCRKYAPRYLRTPAGVRRRDVSASVVQRQQEGLEVGAQALVPASSSGGLHTGGDSRQRRRQRQLQRSVHQAAGRERQQPAHDAATPLRWGAQPAHGARRRRWPAWRARRPRPSPPGCGAGRPCLH